MNFIMRISHASICAARRGPRRRCWLAVCVLFVAAASLAEVNQLRQPGPQLARAEQAAALAGEDAVRQLKSDGGYASLATALAAARYQINAVPAKSTRSGALFYADNPGQRLRATFASDEVRVSVHSNKADGKTEGGELRLELAGYGYGEQIEPLTPGALSANGNRIEITKSAIRDQ